jgi:hypothetical protein
LLTPLLLFLITKKLLNSGKSFLMPHLYKSQKEEKVTKSICTANPSNMAMWRHAPPFWPTEAARLLLTSPCSDWNLIQVVYY